MATAVGTIEVEVYPWFTDTNGNERGLREIDLLATTVNAMMREVVEVNKANGWLEKERSTLEGHMLLVTEVAEASEAWRKWGLADATLARQENAELPKPEGIGSEYADILIRLLDQCYRDNIDLAVEYRRKIAYNRTRDYRHGNKLA